MKLSNEGKKNVSRAILLGVIAAAMAFFYAISLPKEYLVVGKLVVFPSGLATAEKNLGVETGNTVEILTSSAFREFAFQGDAQKFAYARQMGNSSTIAIAFLAEKKDMTSVEDDLVRVPASVAEYTRDLYEGSPFKYKLLSDPEISATPVKPEIPKYLGWGFGIGVLIYFLYWILFDFLRVPAETESIKTSAQKEDSAREVEKSEISAPSEIKEVEKAKSEPRIVEKAPSTPFEKAGVSAPENLPVMEADEVPAPPNFEEPTDEEVKERLNRLMRGEL